MVEYQLSKCENRTSQGMKIAAKSLPFRAIPRPEPATNNPDQRPMQMAIGMYLTKANNPIFSHARKACRYRCQNHLIPTIPPLIYRVTNTQNARSPPPSGTYLIPNLPPCPAIFRQTFSADITPSRYAISPRQSQRITRRDPHENADGASR